MTEHTTSAPAYQFPGFLRPRYTQVPDDLFDELMTHLSGAELKVTLYIIRRTYGFKKDADQISLDQLTDGITTRDGRQLDHGTGLARSTVASALKRLVSMGVVQANRNYTQDGGDLPTTYSLHERGGSEDRTLGESENRQVGVRESYPQDTVKKQKARKTEESRHVDWPDLAINDGDAEAIAEYVDDFRRDLGDKSGQARAAGQVVALYARSSLPLDDFLELMQAARSAAKAHSARNRWAYWYKVLEDRLKA